MKISHVIVTTAFVAASAFSASALAGESAKFSQLDADGNGMISSDEAAADPKLVEEWSTADLNKDGQLERAEFSALEQKMKSDKGK
ncbi:MAG: hypothetical protein QNJ91_11710 [Gammaproteobacteria bacterium]|nr:hypothetical protein [Gammaproteobacteria bacterium]